MSDRDEKKKRGMREGGRVKNGRGRGGQRRRKKGGRG